MENDNKPPDEQNQENITPSGETQNGVTELQAVENQQGSTSKIQRKDNDGSQKKRSGRYILVVIISALITVSITLFGNWVYDLFNPLSEQFTGIESGISGMTNEMSKQTEAIQSIAQEIAGKPSVDPTIKSLVEQLAKHVGTLAETTVSINSKTKNLVKLASIYESRANIPVGVEELWLNGYEAYYLSDGKDDFVITGANRTGTRIYCKLNGRKIQLGQTERFETEVNGKKCTITYREKKNDLYGFAVRCD